MTDNFPLNCSKRLKVVITACSVLLGGYFAHAYPKEGLLRRYFLSGRGKTQRQPNKKPVC